LLREVLGGQDECIWEGHKSGAVHVQQVVEFAALPFWGGCVVANIAVSAHYIFCQEWEQRYLSVAQPLVT
jgi:hypothetical protein